MKIEEALKVNEKVKRPLWLEDEYIMIQDDKFVGPDGLLVGLDPEDAFADDWQPYHEVKEIRPENTEEVWKDDDGDICFIIKPHNTTELRYIWDDGSGEEIPESMIHGKNGWERIFPKPEDDSVERIEFDVTCVAANVLNRSSKSTYQFELPDGYFERILKGSPILEIRKGLTKHP